MVTPFPFDKLPQFTKNDVAISNHLLNAYYFFENRKDTFQRLTEPLKDIFGAQASFKLTSLNTCRLEEMMEKMADNFLVGVVRIEPHGKKAIAVFDPLLAKIAVSQTLTGGKVTSDKVAQLQLKPLTSLEDAIVQYILVSLIEKISESTGTKNFTLTFENTLRDATKLNGQLSNQDEFAIFTLKLHVFDREFYAKLILPMPVVDDFEMASHDEYFASERLKQFTTITTDFVLEVARVELIPQEVDELSVGDMIIFDEASVSIEQGNVSGKAKMKLLNSDDHDGFMVDIESEGSQYKAKIMSAL